MDFENDQAKKVFWHSSAHIMGEACEQYFGCNLCIGPATEEGFYYEMEMRDRVVTQSDYEPIEKIFKETVKKRHRFERLLISKVDLLEMFKHNRYKVHLITEKIPNDTLATVYRCGNLIDLCRGPHLPDTGRAKAFSVIKVFFSLIFEF